MRITLDRLALRDLISGDPEFEFELKAAVLSEIGRRFFEKDAARVIAAAGPELFSQALKSLQADADLLDRIRKALEAQLVQPSQAHYGRIRIDPLVKATIDKAVEDEKTRVTSEASQKLGAAFREAIEKLLQEWLDDSKIEERIEKRLDRLIGAEIDRRVKERFDQKMAELKATLG